MCVCVWVGREIEREIGVTQMLNSETENEDVVRRSYGAREMYWNSARFRILKPFLQEFKPVLSVGSGPYEPIILNADVACDICPLTGQFLAQQGFDHLFLVAPCTNLPFKEHEFGIAVCCEVIEHLSTFEEVDKTFSELNRVAKNWVVTTPCNPYGKLNSEPSHKQFFTAYQLEKYGKVYKHGLHFYVVKSDKNDLFEKLLAETNEDAL